MDDDNDNATSRAPACDSCRSRKIKCDREFPCSSCRAWKITCQTTQRPREKKQRVLISHKYESEFRDLNRKLENLSVTLQSFVDTAKPGDSGPSTILHSQVVDVLASVKQEPDDDEGLFQGESSFPAQYRDVAQIYGSELHGSTSNSDRSASLDPNDVGRSPSKSSWSRDSPAAPKPDTLSSNFPQLAQLPLPPTACVLNALRIAKVHPQKVFIDFPFLNNDRATNMCQKLYFPTEDFTLATYIVVNSTLTYLLRDMEREVADKIGMSKAEQYKYAEICSTNVYVAMRFWNLATEPTYENIEALVVGSFILMEDCHMFRTWTCIGFAARILQDAGFHRQEGLNGLSADERRHRKWLFWTAYSFDHALSLNFGRTANIQDWDITVESPEPDFPRGDYEHGQQILFWIELARTHGQIYERLYSARGLKSPQDDRVSAARELAATVIALRDRFQPFYVEMASQDYRNTAKGATAASQVVLHSTLTMIYKCIPPSSALAQATPKPLQFCDECITAARTALQILDEVWGGIQKSGTEAWRIFIHWCLVGSPFLPFLVIFGNAMNLPNNVDDYHLLVKIGQTIDSAASRSKGLSKLNSICQNFLKVARSRYEPMIQPQQTMSPQQDMQMPINQLPLPGDLGVSHSDPSAFNFMDFSMLDGWELGPGAAESAREMNSYFEQLPESGFWGASV